MPDLDLAKLADQMKSKTYTASPPVVFSTRHRQPTREGFAKLAAKFNAPESWFGELSVFEEGYRRGVRDTRLGALIGFHLGIIIGCLFIRFVLL